MKLKFKNRKKILIIASLIAIILIGAIVSIVVVFAANIQSTETNVKLTYVVNGVGAKVSANYAVLPNDESQLVSTTAMTTADSNETIEFKPSGGTQTASLEPAGDLILTTKKQRAVIEYIFENTANSAFSISLTDKPTGVNMTERYLVSGRRLNMAEYYGYITDTSALAPQALTSNGSVAYIYIMIEVANENKVASYEGEFKWVLEKQNTVTINLDNGDSTGGLTSLDIIPTSSVSGIAMPVINIFPTSTDETMGFAGYFAETNGSGTQYISDFGGSMNEADLTVTDKLYAYFSDVYYILDSKEIVSLTEAGKNMSTLTIPSDVTSIAANAFYGADAEVITYDGAGTDTASYADSAPQLTIVGANAFGGCTNLKELRLPSSVTTIGNNALASCTSLETLEMPYVIGAGEGHVNNLFHSGLSKLFGSTSLDVPKTLLHIIINGGTTIDNYAFYMCNSIVDISIPKSITKMSQASLYCAQGLEYIRVDKDNSIYNDGDGSNCIIETATNNLIQGCKNTIIPESVVSISGDAFNGNKGLTDIVIPKNVERIGSYTFSDCINLSNMTFAEDSQLSSIGISCFADCKDLTRLTIPSSVTTIGNNAFLYCMNLESVTFEDPDGWFLATSGTATSGTNIDVSDGSRNAANLANLTDNANFTESWTSYYLIKTSWATIKYPQTYVGDELNETLKAAYSSGSGELVATGKTYTTDANGSEVVCYEYTYNGEQYARLASAVPYDSSVKFLNSSGGGTITSGAEYWFKVEPIEFDDFTLSDGTRIKMAKMILASKRFDDSSNDWSTSELRTYLNGTFAEESGLDAVAKDYTQYSTKYSSSTTLAENGAEVTDKIWLADCTQIQEFYGTAGSSNETIRKVATDFARATYASVSSSYTKTLDGGGVENTNYFWLRSASSYLSNHVWYVSYYGSFDNTFCDLALLGFSPAFAY